MALISIENLTKKYGLKTLFDEITFHIENSDQIGLVGVNGTGKSTLLKILAGLIGSDSGNITMSKCTRIEYLPQNPVFHNEATVLEQVLKGDSEVFTLLRNYQKITALVEQFTEETKYQAELLALTEKMTVADAWELESQVKTILTKLEIFDFNQKISTLSGGQKKRVALAAALISPCDLLILDEPTNHMDNATIDWLETYLSNRKGALLMVTHDRYFLDRVCNRIIELAHGKCFSYEGNYTRYVTAKAERLELANVLEKRAQNLYRRELAWIRTGAKARSTKQKARIHRFNELKNKEFITDVNQVDISVGYTRLGKKTIILKNLSKSFEGKNLLINNLNYIFLSTDRLGIIGPNGAGKSTLLNLITNKLRPDTGNVESGDTVKIGYFSQEATEMNEQLRVIDYIKETAEYILTESGYQLTASQMLEKFLFNGEIQYAPIHSLSGGEKRRLFLLKVLMEAPNVLIFDEPTNDLDIDTLKVLENYIDDFKGIVITVSHDRYFLDRICNKILSFESDEILINEGNYQDFLSFTENYPMDNTKKENKVHKTANLRKNSNSKGLESISKKSERNNSQKLKLSYKEQQDLLNLGNEIESLENKLDEQENLLKINQSNYSKLQEITDEIEIIELDLLEKMERLEFLENKVEQINEEKKNR